MNQKEAVTVYQLSERSKSELIAASQVIATLIDYKGAEKVGAKRVVVSFLELFRSNLQLATNISKDGNFTKAAGLVSDAISAIESEEYEQASAKIAEAISLATTPAQESWAFLKDNGFL
jgi:hypothetical protein